MKQLGKPGICLVVTAMASVAALKSSCAADLNVTSANSPYIINADAAYDNVVVSGNGELFLTDHAILNAGTLIVGDGSKGSMTVMDGSTVNVTTKGGEKESAPFKIGNGDDAEGFFTLLDGSQLTASYGLFSVGARAKSYVTISNSLLTVDGSVYNTRNVVASGTNSVICLQQGGAFVFGTFFRNSQKPTTLFQFDGGVCTNKNGYLASMDGGWLIFEGINGHPIDYAVLNGTDNGYFVLSGNNSTLGTPHVHLTGNGGMRLYSNMDRKAVTISGTVPDLSAVTSDYTGDLVITSKRLIQTAPNQLFSGKNRIVLENVPGGAAVFDLNGFDTTCASIVGQESCYVLNPTDANAVTLTLGSDNGDSELRMLVCQSPVTVRKVGTGHFDLYTDEGCYQASGLIVEEGTVDLYSREAGGYENYKWVISDTYGKNSDWMWISEVEMFDASGARIDMSNASDTFGNALIDGNLATDICLEKSKYADRAPWFAISFPQPVQVSSYRLGTGADYGTETKYGGLPKEDVVPPAYDVALCRDPSDWIVYGSHDGVNWVEIGNESGYKAPNNRHSWGANIALDYSATVVPVEIKVFPEATLNIKNGKKLVTAGIDNRGTINYAEGVTIELKGGADYIDFTGAGSGSIAGIFKSGSGDSQMLTSRTVTDAVTVKTGDLVMGRNGGITEKYWRFRLKGIRDWWYDPAKIDFDRGAGTFPGRSCLADAICLRELALFDRDGQLVTSGTTVISKPTTVWSSYASWLFDGITDDADKVCWLRIVDQSPTEANTVQRVRIDDDTTWLTFIFKLADDAKPVYSCDIFTHSDHSDRDPAAWDFAVSDDGESWTTIEEHSEVGSNEFVYRLRGTSNPCGRATYGVYNRGVPMYFRDGITPVAADVPSYASTATVEIGAGAMLKVAGDSNVTGSIRIDASQLSDGVLVHFNPAKIGTLDVVNFVKGPGTQQLPLRYVTGENLENIQNWALTVNGKPSRWTPVAENGCVVLKKTGVVLIVR